MTDERDVLRDEELEALLRRWEAPPAPEGMDQRVLAAFREQAGHRPKASAEPLWRRLFASSIRVPVPVALAVALLLLFTVALAIRPASPPPTAVTPPTSSGPVRAARRTPPVETGSSLAGFQPVAEITATVVQEGAP